MGADQDVDLAVGEAASVARTSAGLAQPRDHLDLERELGEPLAEGAEVLLGEDRRRHQHHHLLAVGGGLVRGAQRDLGLAVADVAADQAVHRALGLHVGLDRLDRLELVGGLAIGKARSSSSCHSPSGGKAWPRARAALGVEVEQLAGELAGGAAGARLDVVPALAAQRRELRRLAAGADVAADLGELVGGREDAVLAAVLEVEVVAGDAGDGLRLEAGEAGDAVVLVDDVVADPQVGEGAGAPRRAPERRRGGGGRGGGTGAPRAAARARRSRRASGASAKQQARRSGGGEPRRGSGRRGGRGRSGRARPRRGARRRRRCGSRSEARFSSSASASAMVRAAEVGAWARNECVLRRLAGRRRRARARSASGSATST